MGADALALAAEQLAQGRGAVFPVRVTRFEPTARPTRRGRAPRPAWPMAAARVTRACVECGAAFDASASAPAQVRCPACQAARKARLKREAQRRARERAREARANGQG